MPFEEFEDVETIDKDRRKAITKSIRIISVEELKKLGEEIFDSPDRPWRQTFLSLIAEHPGATFYHASAGEGRHFSYSHDQDKGAVVPARKRPITIVGGRPADDEGSNRRSPLNICLIPARLLLQQFVFRRREFLQFVCPHFGTCQIEVGQGPNITRSIEKIAPSLKAPAPRMKIVFSTRVLYPAFYPPAKFLGSVWTILGAAIQRF